MANVIDTLTMKIGLDNDEFNKDMDESSRKTQSLEDSLEELEDTIQSATAVGTFFGQVLTKAFALIVGKVNEALESYRGYIANLRLIHRETGQSIEDYQKWAYAIEYAGGNVNAFTSTFERLSKQIKQAPFTHNSTFLRGLSELGINVHDANGQIKSMSDLLLGLAGRLSRMSEGKALLLGQRLGLDDDTIRLLHEGKDAVQSYLDKTKEESLIQKQNLELYEKLRKMRVEISKGWKEFSNTVGNAVLPILIKLGDVWLKITGFLKEHKDLVKHTIQLMLVLSGIFAGLIVVVGLLTNSLKLLKLGLWGLGIGAIILLWDDFMTYLEGGDSVIGDVIDKIKEWSSVLGDKLATAIQFVKDFWDGFVDFFARKIEWCINLWDRFIEKIQRIKGWFGIGKDVYDTVSSMSAGATNNTSSISNNTTSWDFRGSTILTRATNGQTFMTELSQQTLINNSEGNAG